MKKIEAVIQPFKLEDVKEALKGIGVDGMTMNRVAAAAQVAKSSLYDYFPGKEELLAFAFDRIAEPFLQSVEQMAVSPRPAAEKLQTILRTAFDRSTQHKALIRLLGESNQGDAMRKKCRPRLLEAFTAIFEQGIVDGWFLPHNPAHTGRMFLGCLGEMFELQASNASEEAVREYVEVLLNAVVHGLILHIEPTPENQAPMRDT